MRKPLLMGVLGSVGLLAFYFVTLKLLSGPAAAAMFLSIWQWIILLALGFGTQVGLYFHVREFGRTVGGKVVAGSAGMSGLSMVACCAHHATDLLPIIGLTAAATFLVQYQTYFLALGLLSNLAGIYMMLRVIGKHKLYRKKGTLHLLVKQLNL